MDEPIRLPDMHEIDGWLDERCQVERARLRNELAFIQGDRARGGPAQNDWAGAVKSRLLAITKRLELINSRERLP